MKYLMKNKICRLCANIRGTTSYGQENSSEKSSWQKIKTANTKIMFTNFQSPTEQP